MKAVLTLYSCLPLTISAFTHEKKYTFERGFPTSTTAKNANHATDLRQAIEAYKFFFPTVATEAVMQQFVPHGAIPNEVGIILLPGTGVAVFVVV